MTEFVPYIEKTRAYYRAAGYTKDYEYARNDSCALAPFTKPLARARIGLVSTASLIRLDDEGQPLDVARMLGSARLEVFPLASDWPAAHLRSTSEDHDRFQTDMSDLGAYFPKDLLRTFAEEGLIGSFATECWRILPNYSKRKVVNVDAPEVLRRAREAGVDAVMLTPV